MKKLVTLLNELNSMMLCAIAVLQLPKIWVK